MTNLEKDILLLISRVRCVTETQIKKIYGNKKTYPRKNFKKTLKRMCNEYTLKKYYCNVDNSIFSDTYVYYLNGGNIYEGEDLFKALLGTELLIKLKGAGYNINRFYRNVSVDNKTYDIYVLYTDRSGELKQLICDIYIDDVECEDIDLYKYRNINNQIERSTIPFFEIPKVLIISSKKICDLSEKYLYRDFLNIDFVNLNLNKLFKYL